METITYTYHDGNYTVELNWRGPGWYAGRQEWDRLRDFWVGDDPNNPPNNVVGLGTPVWRSAPPPTDEND